MRIILITLIVAGCSTLNAQGKHPYQNVDLDEEDRIDNLLTLLTLEEKIHYLLEFEIPRLGIKSPGHAEGIHQAVMRGEGPGNPGIPTTSFAQVYGMGSTWNPELIQEAGKTMAYEARYATQNEKYGRPALMLWGPTSDLARDPRWGRTDESYGEDAFLTGQMAVAYTKGIQGNHPDYWMAGALLKHFFANSNETTRARSSSDFDERLMREYYAKPFEMAFTEAGARAYMASYNAWNGIPMTVHPVLKEVVAEEWGADWVISSDFLALQHLIHQHHYLNSPEEVIAAAIKVGMNQYLDFQDPDIQAALDKKLLSEEDIDRVVSKKLKMSLKLGLLDDSALNPYRNIGTDGESEPWLSEKHKAVALQVARESVVLLKNENILPLDKSKIRRVVVAGPYADTVLYDLYSGPAPYSLPILKGLKDKLGANTELQFFKDNENNGAVSAAKEADYVIVVIGNDPLCGPVTNLGEIFNTDGSTRECKECGEGREGRDRQSLDLPLEDLAKELYAVNKNTILVVCSSFPYAINWSQKYLPSILHITHAAQEQGQAIADVIFGDYNPAGRLTQTWPKGLHQLPGMMDYDLSKGRTYMYFEGDPLYPFGHGLSYTRFEYSNMQLSEDHMAKDGSVLVSVDIKNSGSRDGDEVVQLYVRLPESKVLRPKKALKGFERIRLKAGETTTVSFTLTAESLAWWNGRIQDWEVESGPVHVLLAGSSVDIRLERTMTVD